MGRQDKPFAGYRNVDAWRAATFPDVFQPANKEGFGGYGNVEAWRKATFGENGSNSSRKSKGGTGTVGSGYSPHDGDEYIDSKVPYGQSKPRSYLDIVTDSYQSSSHALNRLDTFNRLAFGRAGVAVNFERSVERHGISEAFRGLLDPRLMVYLSDAAAVANLENLAWIPCRIEVVRHDSWRQNPTTLGGVGARAGSGLLEGHDFEFVRRLVAYGIPIQIGEVLKKLSYSPTVTSNGLTIDNDQESPRIKTKSGRIYDVGVDPIKTYRIEEWIIPGTVVDGAALLNCRRDIDLTSVEMRINESMLSNRGLSSVYIGEPKTIKVASYANLRAYRSITDIQMYSSPTDRISEKDILSHISLLRNREPLLEGIEWARA